jgi:hypothetical protein
VKQFKYRSADQAVNHLDLWVTVDCVVQEGMLNLVVTILDVPPVHDSSHLCEKRIFVLATQLYAVQLASTIAAVNAMAYIHTRTVTRA